MDCHGHLEFSGAIQVCGCSGKRVRRGERISLHGLDVEAKGTFTALGKSGSMYGLHIVHLVTKAGVSFFQDLKTSFGFHL